uniref:Uncharacterized protein n=1 Tax=Ipomoea batatas TaxID=4120 RepID=F8J387_IPOBA|nr:hypothetical protein [Ipomoea batatas]
MLRAGRPLLNSLPELRGGLVSNNSLRSINKKSLVPIKELNKNTVKVL